MLFTIEQYVQNRLIGRDYMYLSDEQIKELERLDKQYKDDKEFRKLVDEEFERVNYCKYNSLQTYYKDTYKKE